MADTLPVAQWYNYLIAFLIPSSSTIGGAWIGAKVCLRRQKVSTMATKSNTNFSAIGIAILIDAGLTTLQAFPKLLAGVTFGGFVGMGVGYGLRSMYVDKYEWRKIKSKKTK